MHPTGFLIGVGRSQERRLIEGSPDHLEPYGKPIDLRTTRQRDGGEPGQIQRTGEAGERRLDPLLDPLNRDRLRTERWGDDWEGGRHDQIRVSEDVGKIPDEAPTRLLSPDVLWRRNELS